ncbi:MAG: uroporphyrinogen-III C-methyltransferase [Candidatus Omnitrophica bacterium CG11_big_fil_rev_8_21_14_0_20_45_26]|uniref:uroporphyrinogen-III C-methyltransferase n=1 Tax=Candidatus Abzuiibacterium crystallinum TaxID=1974748 RepID=A0A2H0LN24_9BACT|nr:MAG: uroporphyrinogen-III C-methyltransferase [Candidatus Omnitrophica bacterium CG11_big_fil_rev_8_21_14_0_20_45_26]PIW63849.1 MAG: uroporphyrinogen-III C-methyltransferase [Candidatus Omnitrophica bacterium CG12_big_fil_rev_8_21_14_0_65_45_16]
MKKKKGMVYLVGAGPGDPELITIRAERLLRICDAVVYDHLVHAALLDLAPAAAEKIYVGKKGASKKRTQQSAIDRLLIRLAQSGKTVVRLKGGDPFVFGRGGEEILALNRKRIPFEVVPGITAGFSVPAYAGIPVTHRAFASEVTLVTAHENPAKSKTSIDWKTIAALKGTLVIYMGMKLFENIIGALIKYGKPPSTPVAVIQKGTTANQKTVVGTLKTILGLVRKANMSAPAITVVGKVVRMRRLLKWYEEKPLFGKSIMITRAPSQASKLRMQLERLGAQVIEFPTIDIRPVRDTVRLDQAIRNLAQYDWLVLTSENGVTHLMARLKLLGLDARQLHHVKIAAVGPGTDRQLQTYGLRADLIPSVFSTQGLFEAMQRRHEIKGKRILLLRANIVTHQLKEAFETEGGITNEVSVYETRKPKMKHRQLKQLIAQTPIDYITFTSASTARHFFDLFPRRERYKLKPRCVSIGPVTSKAIAEAGGRIYREAKPYNIPGLIAALTGNRKK